MRPAETSSVRVNAWLVLAERALDFARVLRIHYWPKNLLILLPPLVDQSLLPHALSPTQALALAAFCLLSSGVYVSNDLVDLRADQANPEKRLRPIASGRIPIGVAFFFAALLILQGILLSALASPVTLGIALSYLLMNVIYNAGAKKSLPLNVTMLTFFLFVRVIAGEGVFGFPSHPAQLGALILFIASLASLKRFVEPQPTTSSAHSGTLPYIGAACLAASGGLYGWYILTVSHHAFHLAGILALGIWAGRLWMNARQKKLPADLMSYVLRDSFTWTVLSLLSLGTLLPL